MGGGGDREGGGRRGEDSFTSDGGDVSLSCQPAPFPYHRPLPLCPVPRALPLGSYLVMGEVHSRD